MSESTASHSESSGAFAVEVNALNPIAESERKGKPSGLFWPWFGANVSVLGLVYGPIVLSMGLSFWQAAVFGAIGIAVSFLLCGFVALAGRRGSAPTMVLSRAAFGVDGNRLSSVLSWILTVGWETVLTATAVFATNEVFGLLGWGKGVGVEVGTLIVVVLLVVGSGIFGFDLIMRMQVWITVITGVLTIVYFVLVIPSINWGAVSAIKAGGWPAMIGGLVFMMTGFGLGWLNAAADYSRYLPRSASTKGIVFWTTFGGALAPVVLLVFGLLLAGSSPKLSGLVGAYSIGGLATISPTWFLIPFLIVGILGLVGGAALDIYSSGLSLLSVGLKAPRYVAAAIDGVIMTLGAIYIVFISTGNFFSIFQAFLTILGVPIAAWGGVMLADILLRRKNYHQDDLYNRRGRYGSVNWVSVGLVVVGTALGWGLITNETPGFTWLGYLLFHARDQWGGANLGILVALVVGFGGALLNVGSVRRQEAVRDRSDDEVDVLVP